MSKSLALIPTLLIALAYVPDAGAGGHHHGSGLGFHASATHAPSTSSHVAHFAPRITQHSAKPIRATNPGRAVGSAMGAGAAAATIYNPFVWAAGAAMTMWAGAVGPWSMAMHMPMGGMLL